MGFRLPERVTTLVFDEGEYAGAEVTVRLARNVGMLWQVNRLMAKPEGETTEEKVARLGELHGLLANDIVVSWNIEDHKGPIPVTPDDISRVDADFLGRLLYLWMAGVAGVPAPLGKPSSAGGAARRSKTRNRQNRPS